MGEHEADTTVVVKDNPKKPYKAIAAALTPLVVLFVGFLLPGSDGGSSITSSEIGVLLATVLGTGGVTFGVTNPKVRKRTGHDWERDQRGEITRAVAVTVIVVAVLVAAVLLVRCDGNDRDGRRGLDWEKTQDARHGLDWERLPTV